MIKFPTITITITLTTLVFLAAACNRGPRVELAGQTVRVEVADEPHEHYLGLGGRESLATNEGMLFVFDQPKAATFWMKDMFIPIDIVWIKDDQVVNISANALPEPGVEASQLRLYSSGAEVDSVLELPAGWAEKNNLKVGDEVKVYLPQGD